jgi:methylmalonyl-CoA/ethylmalonyl-CoA epimerase
VRDSIETQVDQQRQPVQTYKKIDHIAIAVIDLDAGIDFFCNTLGFKLIQRRVISGKRTGMVSAEIEHNDIKFVLCQGTEPESQVSRLVEHFGPGVAHIALAVEQVEQVADGLRDQGLQFDTTVIKGAGLTQIFSKRDPNSGLSFEFIERGGEEGFLEENVNALFEQLEMAGAY